MNLIVDGLNTFLYVIYERLIKPFFFDAFISPFVFLLIFLRRYSSPIKLQLSPNPNIRQSMKTIKGEEKSKKKERKVIGS